MKTESVATIALKVLAVYVVLSLLAFLPSALALVQMWNQARALPQQHSASSPSLLPSVIASAITVLAYGMLAIVLFFKTHRISRYVTAGAEEEFTLSGPRSREVLTLAFRCLGIYALVTWLPQLAQSITKAMITIAQSPEPVPWLYRFLWVSLVTPLVGSLVGVLLLFRPEAIVRLTDSCGRQQEN